MLAHSSRDGLPLKPFHSDPIFAVQPSRAAPGRPFEIRAVDDALFSSEGDGLPQGAVVELSSPRGLCRSTTLALSTCAGAQRRARLRAGPATEGAWCAWIDVSGSLHAGGAARLGVDLDKLLVIRPRLEIVPRVASRVVASRAFAVVVVDIAGVPGAPSGEVRLDRWSTAVRRLALAAEGGDTTVLVLTDRYAVRSMPLPVAMRIDLEASAGGHLSIRVAKDRRGRVTSPRTLALDPVA